MNPPVRSLVDKEYLWSAINDGVIDTIASDHAPHMLSEKETSLCKCPSGVPGIETTLPLLLTAHTQGKISLSKIIDLAYTNPKKIFNVADNDDLVFVNISKFKILQDNDLSTKVKWSPYVGMKLTGFPDYIFSNNRLYYF
ncbi:MAG: hypothetical protein K2P99_06875, partial [Burkholderiales bacterium]|nr:hypothetical protein [Burkholderiales bacterium]